MAKNIKTVLEILHSKGPLLTSDLAEIYRKRGLSATAARQRVYRRSKEVRTLYGLPFPKNTKFLYLESHFGEPRFFDALVTKLEKTSPSYAAAISGLSARNGICLVDNWDIVSGSPVLQQKHIASQEILKRLKSVKLFSEITVTGIGTAICFNDRVFAPNVEGFRARITLENILINIVKNWAVRMGYSSTGTISMRSDAKTTLPKFSTHCFDIVGPSYLHSVTKRSKGNIKNGYFVADVLWHDELTEKHVSSFLHKIKTLSVLRGLSNFQPMIIANGFTKKSLMKCRGNGVMAVTPDTLLGRDVAQALLELFDVLKRAAEISIGNPDKIEQIFNKLSAIEGLTANLRGAMFEMITGHIVRSLNAGSIDIGEIVTDYATQSKADIDVRLVSENSVTCYECKGYASHVEVSLSAFGLAYLSNFLTNRQRVLSRLYLGKIRPLSFWQSQPLLPSFSLTCVHYSSQVNSVMWV